MSKGQGMSIFDGLKSVSRLAKEDPILGVYVMFWLFMFSVVGDRYRREPSLLSSMREMELLGLLVGLFLLSVMVFVLFRERVVGKRVDRELRMALFDSLRDGLLVVRGLEEDVLRTRHILGSQYYFASLVKFLYHELGGKGISEDVLSDAVQKAFMKGAEEHHVGLLKDLQVMKRYYLETLEEGLKDFDSLLKKELKHLSIIRSLSDVPEPPTVGDMDVGDGQSTDGQSTEDGQPLASRVDGVKERINGDGEGKGKLLD